MKPFFSRVHKNRWRSLSLRRDSFYVGISTIQSIQLFSLVKMLRMANCRIRNVYRNAHQVFLNELFEGVENTVVIYMLPEAMIHIFVHAQGITREAVESAPGRWKSIGCLPIICIRINMHHNQQRTGKSVRARSPVGVHRFEANRHHIIFNIYWLRYHFNWLVSG